VNGKSFGSSVLARGHWPRYARARQAKANSKPTQASGSAPRRDVVQVPNRERAAIMTAA
jgi:hypothetical protein